VVDKCCEYLPFGVVARDLVAVGSTAHVIGRAVLVGEAEEDVPGDVLARRIQLLVDAVGPGHSPRTPPASA
jgi:hypothetical protein